jgi:hypothetical protein
MPIDTATPEGEDQHIFVHDRPGFLIRRNTNNVIVELEQDEVLALIADLAEKAYMGKVSLLIESDKIYAKDMD